MATSAKHRNGAALKHRKKTTRATSRRRTVRRTPVTALARAQRALTGAVSGDVSNLQNEVNAIVHDLEDRLDRLNSLTRRGASHAVDGVNDLVYGTISDVTGRVRDRAQSMSNDVAKMGNKALGRVSKEIDQHPLLTLAIAAGIGFIAGLSRRSD